MYQDQTDYRMDYTDYSSNINYETANLQPCPSTSTNGFNFTETPIMNRNVLTAQNSLNQNTLMSNLSIPNQFSPNSFESCSITSSSLPAPYSYTAASSPNMPLGMSAQSPGAIPNKNIARRTISDSSQSIILSDRATPQSALDKTILMSSAILYIIYLIS